MRCIACGKPLVSKRRDSRYCDEACRSLYRRRQGEGLPALLPTLVPDLPPALDKPKRRSSLPTGDQNPVKKAEVLRLLARGYTLAATGRRTGLSAETIRAIADHGVEEGLPRPVPPDPEAVARALVDFDYFRTRYFGRVVMPWQSDAGKVMADMKATTAKEFVVLNVFPGSGKTTLFAHDLVAWFSVRDRSLRTLVGSRTLRQAQMYTNRLRRTFSRIDLAPVDDEDVGNGLAVYPTGSLAEDFGRFQPISREEMWTADQFVLYQWGEPVTNKEASFTAFGMDSGFLGGRFDIVVWDDLIDHKTLRTMEARENVIRLYEDEVEPRLDPGGLLVLQGQRMATDDLYRHCLNMRVGVDEETGDEGEPKYHHIVYRAHHEDLCRGIETHGANPKPWPDGCLLDPKRLPWREIAAIRAGRMEKWAVLYQQEDVDPERVLVQRVWIDGGKDPLTGELHPGCWDHDRGLAEIPAGLTSPWVSVVAADPSPTRFWAIGWFLVERSTERRYLLDLIRQPMEEPEFIDWDYGKGAFTGVMEDWQTRSVRLGVPISHWIVEVNAARFLFQHDYVKRWQAKHRVALIPHTTQTNRNDKDYGVQTIGPHYKFGRVRLPGKTTIDGGSAPGRAVAMKLVDEVCRFPDGSTDDTVLMHWFLEFVLPRITPPIAGQPKQQRPSWLA